MEFRPAAADPAERLARYRAKFVHKEAAVEDRRFASLTAEDLALLAELPPTPPDVKDARLVEFRQRLLAR